MMTMDEYDRRARKIFSRAGAICKLAKYDKQEFDKLTEEEKEAALKKLESDVWAAKINSQW